MFLEPAALSIIISKLRGGKFRNLENVQLEGVFFLFLATLTQTSLLITRRFQLEVIYDFLQENFFYVIILSYIILVMAIYLDLKKNYMKVLLVGVLLNAAVIASNGGKMPVSLTGITGIGQESVLPDREFDIKHTGVDGDTRLVYLADIILIDRPYPLPKILSIGDLFIMAGVFLFFQKEMEPQ
ncbi:MAG: DUF5317 domain-containing protein [Bacillota bacterium]